MGVSRSGKGAVPADDEGEHQEQGHIGQTVGEADAQDGPGPFGHQGKQERHQEHEDHVQQGLIAQVQHRKQSGNQQDAQPAPDFRPKGGLHQPAEA